jgi:hypothetical protein
VVVLGRCSGRQARTQGCLALCPDSGGYEAGKLRLIEFLQAAAEFAYSIRAFVVWRLFPFGVGKQ